MRIVTGDAIEVHFALRLLDRSVDHAYCYNYPGVNGSWNCGACSVGH